MARIVRVRIAVAVDPSGNWSSAGWKTANPAELHGYAVECLDDGERHYWLEADLEVPEISVIQAKSLLSDAQP